MKDFIEPISVDLCARPAGSLDGQSPYSPAICCPPSLLRPNRGQAIRFALTFVVGSRHEDDCGKDVFQA